MWYIIAEMSLNIKQPKIVVIVGPTASGKSDLGIKIAQKIGGEIISADSRQVYRGMDIGTGKVPRDRIKKLRIPDSGLKNRGLNSQFVIRNSDYYSEGIRHHLLDVASPKKQFTADDFKKLGEKAIKEIVAKGKIPVIVGGTGFYVDILLDRMAVAPVPPNKKLRAELEKQSAEQLFKRLSALDPQRSKTIDRYNKRRLVRALEIVMTTKKSSFTTNYLLPATNYQLLWLGLKPKNLEKRIEKRLDQRLKPSFAKATAGKRGMIKEIEELHKQGVSWKRLDSFGLEYRWVSKWLINKLRIPNYGLKTKSVNSKFVIRNSEFKKSDEYQILLNEIIKYSKRQMTWFKRNKDIHWINNKKEALSLASAFLI